MKKSGQNDAQGSHDSAYETMYEHVAANLHKVKENGGPLLHELIDEARDKITEVEQIAEEDAEKIADWLKRDLEDVVNYLAETDYAVKEWLGFESALIGNEIIRMLLETADKTTLELLRIKENAHQPGRYHTGEIAGPGTLICDQCGEKLHFHNAGHIPPCAKCHGSDFHRILID